MNRPRSRPPTDRLASDGRGFQAMPAPPYNPPSMTPNPAPERRRRRRWPIPILFAALVLAGSYVGLWLWAEHQLDQGYARWASLSRAQGWNVASAPPREGTAPWAATLLIPDLVISGGDAEIPGGLEWRSDRVVIELSLLHPRVLVIRALGAQRLRLSSLPEVPYRARDFHAEVPLQAGEPPRRLDIRSAKLSLELPEPAAGPLNVAQLDLHLQWATDAGRREPALSVAMRAADLLLPGQVKWPLGPHVALVSGDAALNGQMPREADTLAQRAAAWRDAGGQVKAQRFMLTWGALTVSGTGSIGLDGSLQPAGSGMAQVVDPTDALNALVAHGAISRRAAFAINAVLALMQRVPEGGGSPVVELPLTIQDRTLSIGNIPLAKLPMVIWPEL